MTDPTYCTASDVQVLLGLSTAFSASTTPTLTQVNEMILDKEDEIDNATGHAWKSRYSGTSSGDATSANYEYLNLQFQYRWGLGIPVFLKHRKIRTLDSDEGDALDIWNGSDWEDWLGSMSSGRANDYWLEAERGILFIKWYSMSFRRGEPLVIRIKYRYGDSTVNRQIKDVCAKMVAIELAMSDDRSVLLPEGTSNISLSQKVRIWNDEIQRVLESYKEWTPLAISLL